MNKKTFLVCSLGEILIDFTSQGRNGQNQLLFAQNAGGAPANVAAAVAKLGAKSAFIGKAGDTFWGAFLYRFGMNGEASCRLTVDKMREFTLYANVAASLSVEKFGGISSLPSPEDIENIYDLLV